MCNQKLNFDHMRYPKIYTDFFPALSKNSLVPNLSATKAIYHLPSLDGLNDYHNYVYVPRAIWRHVYRVCISVRTVRKYAQPIQNALSIHLHLPEGKRFLRNYNFLNRSRHYDDSMLCAPACFIHMYLDLNPLC